MSYLEHIEQKYELHIGDLFALPHRADVIYLVLEVSSDGMLIQDVHTLEVYETQPVALTRRALGATPVIISRAHGGEA